ncbi:ComF family protein [Paenibacillus sp. CF384]|uniref:ComF family protein n=1 Tax=Paenibacillus sp. CF384 TaxID=1884382 RepID=UPI000B86FF3D|nr:ComF family protein [Paenibacillus sp. CF384]
MAKMLLPAYRGMLAQNATGSQTAFRFDAVIPVPVSDERLQERGFNQAERLASYLADREQLALHDILRRTRHSDKQSLKTRGARLRDTERLFTADIPAATAMLAALKSEILPCQQLKLLLVDDIYTTGSTANSCAQALNEVMRLLAPNRRVDIYILTLARS